MIIYVFKNGIYNPINVLDGSVQVNNDGTITFIKTSKCSCEHKALYMGSSKDNNISDTRCPTCKEVWSPTHISIDNNVFYSSNIIPDNILQDLDDLLK